MPIWSKNALNTQSIQVLLFEQFSNYCLANAIEPLRAANTLSGQDLYTWEFTTIDGGPVQSSSGLPVLPRQALATAPKCDYLFVMPSYGVRDHANVKTARALKAAAKRARYVAGFDTGSWLLAAAGLLDDRTATIHWDEQTAFAEAFSKVNVVSDRFTDDGPFMTCGGVTTAFDLVSDIIRRTQGEALHLEVSSLFVPPDDAPDRVAGATRGRHHLADQATALMRQNLEQPLRIADIADALQISQRKLEQIFQVRFATSPRAVYKRLRLLAARRYVEHADYPIAEIALRCGYQNPASMTRAFVREFGITPSALRRPDAPRTRPSGQQAYHPAQRT